MSYLFLDGRQLSIDTDSDRAKDKEKAKKAKDFVLGTELKANSSHRHGNRASSKMFSNRC